MRLPPVQLASVLIGAAARNSLAQRRLIDARPDVGLQPRVGRGHSRLRQPQLASHEIRPLRHGSRLEERDEDEDEEEEYPGNTDALPSGEDLARELEEFLREQRRERGQE